MSKNRSRYTPALAVALALASAAPLPSARAAAPGMPRPAAAATAAAPDLAARLAAIEKAVDEKRVALGIPGISLVIVKDDAVIYMKGLGYKDFEKKLAVTPDTLFAIGSSTKAFTAMAAAMSADDGKLSLDDSPKKYLSYFKLRDPEADAKITLRDLLCHRSGLNRTDLAMVSGKLNAEELIRVAGEAKPTAKFREKFLYQNIMYTAAGLSVAKANNSTWDDVVASRIFKPLGMKATNTSVEAMEKAPDFSYGYEYNSETKETRRLPFRSIDFAKPAGAINSNARDMAEWLRFMLASGVRNGKRLVSEKSFAELETKQIAIGGGGMGYGLGWFLRDWKGHKVVEHGGNIDGFNAEVAMMPDQKLGFCLLTNVTGSSLGETALSAVWTNMVDTGETAASAAAPPADAAKPSTAAPSTAAPTTVSPASPSTAPATAVATATATDPQVEVGTYSVTGLQIDVTYQDGRLVATTAGQPPYPLENLGGRRYKLGAPAPDGFFATFRPAAGGGAELFLEQPQGNVTLAKVTAEAREAAAKAAEAYAGPLKELLGSYKSDTLNITIDIALRDGAPALVVPGQSPYPLVEKSKDLLASPKLPDAYAVEVKRDAAGAVSGIVMRQPQGNLELTRLASFTGSMTVDELMAKVVAAMGGEANLRRHTSMTETIAVDFENQGVTGEGTVFAAAPRSSGQDIKLFAIGKEIGWVYSYFDGEAGGEQTSFSPVDTLAGKQLDEARIANDFYGPLNWKSLYKSVTIRSMDKVGDEDVFVVVKTPEKGNPTTDYISTKTFLIVKRDTLQSSATSEQTQPSTERYEDFREVGGLVLPFKITQSTASMGDVVLRIRDVKFDAPIAPAVFKPRAGK